MTLQLGANIPAAVLAAGAFSVLVQYNYGTGGSPTATATLVNATIATSGDNAYAVTFTCPAPVSQAEFGTNSDDHILVSIGFQMVQSQAVTWDYMQLEEGAAASPLEQLTYNEEFARCSPHFVSSYGVAGKLGQASYAGDVSTYGVGTSTSQVVSVTFPERMLAVPTVTLYSSVTADAPGKVYNDSAAADVAGTSTASKISTNGFNRVVLGAAAVAGNLYSFHWAADAESY